LVRSLKDLINTAAQPGKVEWIGLRAARREAMQTADSVEVTKNGLTGDHGRPGKRAVTLIQAEHLHVVGSFLGQDPIDPSLLRRNLVVAGINLLALKGRTIQIGTATLAITAPCAPCSRMEEALGTGGYSAVRGHGGVTANVVQPGTIKLGDRLTPTTIEA
jgi:MOSC domain-containing protein YiiM